MITSSLFPSPISFYIYTLLMPTIKLRNINNRAVYRCLHLYIKRLFKVFAYRYCHRKKRHQDEQPNTHMAKIEMYFFYNHLIYNIKRLNEKFGWLSLSFLPMFTVYYHFFYSLSTQKQQMLQ